MAENEIRIKDLPLAQQINETDDVIVLDNATDGTRKLQGKVLLDMIHSAMAKGTASGAIASFTDGADNIPMTDLVVSIEPQQDLHGYDAPWVGGAGKNKLPLTVDGIKSANGGSSSWSGNATTINGVTFTILTDSDNNVTGIKVNGTASINTGLKLVDTITNITPYDNCIINGCPSGGSTSKYRIGVASYDSSSAFVKDYNDLGSGVTLTFSQDNVSKFYVSITIYQGYNAQNLVFKPMIRLASVTDSTFAPYSNECPISGWTACNVVRAGENLFDKATITENKIIDSTTGEEIVFYGRFSSDYIKVNPSTDYYASNVIRGAKWYCVFYYDKNKNYLSCGELPSTGDNASGVVTTPSGCNYVRLVGVSTYKDDVSFVVGNQAPSSYSAYNGNTYTINFVDGSSPLTVYGGTLDVLSGVMTVTHGIKVYSGNSSEGWYADGTQSGTTYRMKASDVPNNIKLPPSNADAMSAISNQFNATSADNIFLGNEGVGIPVNGGYLTVYDSVYNTNDVSLWKTHLASNPMQLVYELATPQTYQLTPTQVKSLLGVNNIFADTGNIINAEYVRDTTTIINQILARLDALES